MKKKIAPLFVLECIKNMFEQGVDIFDIKAVKDHLIKVQNLNVVEWISGNRELYTYTVLSKQYEDPGFYYDGFKR